MGDLVRDFLSEVREHFDLLAPEVSLLRQDPDNSESYYKILKRLHNIKGACGFIGAPEIERLVHGCEEIVCGFLKGAPVTQESMGLFLRALAHLERLIQELSADHVRIDDLRADLEKRMGGASEIGNAGSPQKEPQDSAPAFSSDPIATQGSSIPPLRSISQNGVSKIETSEDSKKTDRKTEDLERISSQPLELTVKKSVRLGLDLLEQFINLVGDLVLARNQLTEVARTSEGEEFDRKIENVLQNLSNVILRLQEEVLKLRMQPVSILWNKFPGVIRALSKDIGKSIKLVMEGEDTMIDRRILEMIRDPLVHILRNCADHGIESPQERVRLGKPEEGTIRISATCREGFFIISVSDDGRGFSQKKIEKRILELDLATAEELAQMDAAQVQSFVFSPGFSTAEKITGISGRGVGMDVVRENVVSVGGRVEFCSNPGKGTKIILTVPLNFSILPALLVEVQEQFFAINQLSILEILNLNRISEEDFYDLGENRFLKRNGLLVPLVHLREHFDSLRFTKEGGYGEPQESGKGRSESARESVVVFVQVRDRALGILVDRVFQTEEIVVKALPFPLQDCALFSGSAILGNGKLALILVPDVLLQDSAVEVGSSAEGKERKLCPVDSFRENESSSVSLLLFQLEGKKIPQAIPVSLVADLCYLEGGIWEEGNPHPLMPYQNTLIPIAFFSESQNLQHSSGKYVVVFGEGKHFFGLVVEGFLDVKNGQGNIDSVVDRPGVLGLTVVDGQLVEVVDVSGILKSQFKSWSACCGEFESPSFPHVLIVDDFPFSRNTFSAFLESHGFFVEATGTRDPASFFPLEAQNFDAILLCGDLSTTETRELLERFGKVRRWNSALKVVLLESRATDFSGLVQHFGFDDCFLKSDRDSLLEYLKQVRSRRIHAA